MRSSAGRTTSTPCSTGRCWGWRATIWIYSFPPRRRRAASTPAARRATVPPSVRGPWALRWPERYQHHGQRLAGGGYIESARAAGGGCGQGASLTLAAQIKGLQSFRTPSHLAGILLNDCKPGLYKMLAPMLEAETGLPVVGFLPPGAGGHHREPPSGSLHGRGSSGLTAEDRPAGTGCRRKYPLGKTAFPL